MRVNVAVLLFTVVFAATVCRAQHDLGSHNFETINIALGAEVPVGEAYDGLWSVQPGVTGRVATEFYGGIAHLAVGVFDNKNRGGRLPDFIAVQSELGWGYPVALPARVTLTGGGTIGAMSLLFRDHELADNANEIETEVTSGLFARLDIPLARALGGFAEVRWTRVFTAERISLTSVQGGLNLTLSTPAWLRRFLQ